MEWREKIFQKGKKAFDISFLSDLMEGKDKVGTLENLLKIFYFFINNNNNYSICMGAKS